MERQIRLAIGILILLLMSPWSSMVRPESDASPTLDLDRNVEFSRSERMRIPTLLARIRHL